ncbi:DUF4256 domain-containing protein [Gramella sp. MAR_2010_147]|uniref:DUF4256 domain-containing protein n=1 Tax=Gramella sp. MAR_2010_147 TaxID=1250205 RepID=UPI00087C009F|nr:DUF4256 domain-containing protein [Gramella sp. MAR_2010_147]SDS22802.1 Protein of unknown function [Gramella sp. MAR_2010_147]
MKLTNAQQAEILNTLKIRFEENRHRHKDLKWDPIEMKLKKNPEKLWSLQEMEITGGDPDVVDFDSESEQYIFFDCSAESPDGRRSLCYDEKALKARKKHKPRNSAMEIAKIMGVEILNEAEYRKLQATGSFDTKTSSWLKTPSKIRNLGGAIFADFRYGQVFVYHNGAESYYAGRGFRGSLKV